MDHSRPQRTATHSQKLEQEKYIKNLTPEDGSNAYWLEKVQKRAKKQPAKKRRSNLLSHIKTMDQLLQERTLFERALKILGEMKSGHHYKHSAYEKDDDLVQLLMDLELIEYNWKEIEKQTHRDVGNRIIEFSFDADKVLPLRDRVSGKGGIVRKEALELIARDIGERFSLSQIHSIFTDLGVPETMLIEGTKWRVVFYILSYYTTSKDSKDHFFFLKLLERVTHPLSFKGDEDEAKKTQEQYNKYLKYDRITLDDNKAYIGPTDNEIDVGMEDWVSSDGEVVEPKSYIIDPFKVADLWVYATQLLILVGAYIANNALDKKELEELYLLLIDKAEDLIEWGQVGNLKEHYSRPFTSLATAKVEATIKGVESPVELINQFLVQIITLTPEQSVISKKLKEHEALIERVTTATRAISDNESGKLDLDALSYEQALFMLKVVTGQLFQILDVSATGYIGMADEKMNTQYVKLMDYYEKLLSREDLTQLADNRPEYIPKHLLEAFDEMDVWWNECNGQSSMMSFIGDIETDWIRTGQQTFPMPSWLITFFNETGSITSQHRKTKAKKWQQITKNIDEEVKQNSGPFAYATASEEKVQKHEHVHRFENSVQEKPIDLNFNQTPSDTKKKDGYPYTIPDGTRWEDIYLMFTNDDAVHIQVRGTTHQTGFADMGFADGRKNGESNELWVLLRLLAKRGGSLPVSDPEAKDKYKQQKSRLSAALKQYFRIASDPFERYSKEHGYTLRMAVSYPEPPTETTKETLSSETDELFKSLSQ